MFRIQLYVDDKNLGELLKRLSGIARGVEHQYVPNLETSPTKSNGTHLAAVDGREMFVKEMHKRKLTSVNANTAREIMTSMGFSPTSYSYMLQGLTKSGVLKKTGTPQKYAYHLKEK